MTIESLMIQALGLTGSLIAITSLQSGDRRKILTLQVLCCVLWTAHYALLGAYTAVLTNIVGLCRALLFARNDRPWAKSRVWLWVFLGLYAECAALTWEGFVSVLPCFSMMLTTVALWVHNMRVTRLLYVLNSPPIFLYNVLTGSWSCAAIEIVAFCSFLLAVWRFDIRKTQDEPVAEPV